MKYTLYFFTIAALLLTLALQGGRALALVWPAANALAISFAYYTNNPRLFGKRKDGRISLAAQLFFAPYFLFNQTLWHALRIVERKDALVQISETLFIGRRLLRRELPSDIVHVIDLTAEFSSVRHQASTHHFAILDTSAPSIAELISIVDFIETLDDATYIHCAQGHGRTGLISAALLMKRQNLSAKEAVAKLQQHRPTLSCSRTQLLRLEAYRKLAAHHFRQ